jgi:hypothetical protein
MTLPVPLAFTIDPPKIAKLAAEPNDWANAGEGPSRNAANPAVAKRLKYTPFIASTRVNVWVTAFGASLVRPL